MYHLLLVDDEDLTVERLRDAIPWDTLGVGRVFTAYSMRQAQRVFLKEHVDIMICDIEMPAGTGLDLLQWVRDNGYATTNIFLTGHANFSYAKTALSLQTLEYILKPVAFDEVKAVVSRAVQQLNRTRFEKEKKLSIFFREIISGETLSIGDSIAHAAERLGLHLPPGLSFTPVLLENKDNFELQNKALLWDTKSAVQNILADTIPDLLLSPILFSNYILLLFKQTASADAISAACRKALAAIESSLSLSVIFCIGGQASPQTLRAENQRLLQYGAEIVAEGGVFPFVSAAAGSSPVRHCPSADFLLCTSLLEQGNADGATAHIRACFYRLPEINRSVLCAFYEDYWKMICFLLERHNLKLNLLNGAYPEAVTHSAARMLAWVEQVNRKAAGLFSADANAGNAIEQAKKYIDTHVYSAISRNQVAESVHLSPEYLSRMFKRELGVSLIEYITQTKLNTAKGLLAHSDLSISQISDRLGYGNFAYFSQLFRVSFGVTPSEFRRNAKAGRPDGTAAANG